MDGIHNFKSFKVYKYMLSLDLDATLNDVQERKAGEQEAKKHGGDKSVYLETYL